MKKSVLSFVVAVVSLCLFPAFADSSASVLKPAKFVASGCGGFASSDEAKTKGFDDDFKQISWDVKYSDGNLILTVYHFMENCCVEDGFDSSITLEGNTISFDVFPLSFGMCDCICDYDLASTYEGIAPGHYTLKLNCPYADPVIVEIDLADGFDASYNLQSSNISEIEKDSARLSFCNGVVNASCPGKFRIDIFSASGNLLHSLDASDNASVGLGADFKGVRVVRLTPAEGRPISLPVIQ